MANRFLGSSLETLAEMLDLESKDASKLLFQRFLQFPSSKNRRFICKNGKLYNKEDHSTKTCCKAENLANMRRRAGNFPKHIGKDKLLQKEDNSLHFVEKINHLCQIYEEHTAGNRLNEYSIKYIAKI